MNALKYVGVIILLGTYLILGYMKTQWGNDNLGYNFTQGYSNESN